MEKWLRKRALTIVMEMANNTNNGLKGLKEFAEYAGYAGEEELVYSILKGVSDHTKYCMEYPEAKEILNEIKIKL